jgi:hypothetical protein
MGWAWRTMAAGVYVQFKKSSDAAEMFVPYKPLFKLSPLGAEEPRWQPARTIVVWAAGIAVVGGAGWRLLARRRERHRYGIGSQRSR